MSEVNIPYTKHDVTENDVQSVVRALESNALTNGEALLGFEDDFSAHVGAPYAAGVSSGTAGLHLAVEALGIKPGQTVLLPSLTFAASANALLYAGTQIEFVDVDPETLVIDPDAVEERLTSKKNKYAGVLAVDFAGYPVDSKHLSDICRENNAWLVEDGAHALGAVSRRHGAESRVGDGQFADATVFSFHPAKHITTGEGGMVTTASEELDAKTRLLRSHAMDKSTDRSVREGWYYRINELGYNYRMSEINAALGASQLRRAEDNLARRQEIAERYIEAFRGTDIRLPQYDLDQTNAYHLFVIRTDDRQSTYDALNKKGIHPQVHYVPLHMQPFYSSLGENNELPHTEDYYSECLSIPMYPSLSAEEQEYVIDAINECSR